MGQVSRAPRLRWGYNSLSAALLKDLAEEEPINTRPGGGLKDLVELFTTKMGERCNPVFAYLCLSRLKTAPSKVDEDLVG